MMTQKTSPVAPTPQETADTEMSIVQTRQPPPAQPSATAGPSSSKGEPSSSSSPDVHTVTAQPVTSGPPVYGSQVPSMPAEPSGPKFDPNTGEPIAQPIAQPSGPKFDPNTGQPIARQPTGLKFDPNTGQPIAQPSGPKFDPNTGQPIPKFDGETGKQNW